MKSMGLQTYRFSTSWSRVRPDGGAVNPQGVDFYKRLTDELLDAGILPWLTLYHWDLPQALQDKGGWTNRDTADLFTEYALDMHDALGDRVNVLDDAQRAVVLVVPLATRPASTLPATTAPPRACSPRTTCCSATARRSASCGPATRR